MPRILVFTFHSKIIASLLFTGIVFACGTIIIVTNFHSFEQISGINVYQSVPECSCRRKYIFPKNNRQRWRKIGKLIRSSCSDDGTWYEPFQNVVTFSYYNPYKITFPQGLRVMNFYITGLIQNLRKIRQLYPGYMLRLYTNATLHKGDAFCQLVCENADVHWCDIRKVPGYADLSRMYPMTWRFLSLGDSTVDVFLSRDLDSVITEREVSAVTDWLKVVNESGRGIQLMRDHISHNYPFLGGLWGASNRIIGKTTAKALQRQLVFWSRHSSLAKRKGFDQSVLNGVIFSKRGDLISAYDSYHCLQWYGHNQVKPFPVKRKDETSDFVGNPNFGKGVYQLERCPEECRPTYGKDWEFC